MLAKIAIFRDFLRGDGTVLRPCGFVNKPFIHEKTGIDYELTSMYWRLTPHAGWRSQETIGTTGLVLIEWSTRTVGLERFLNREFK
ncbi:hypothetical protein ASD91_23770 [Pseudomonas sp. Root68]|nr:hypothetical protein ASD91_23770 [Pseudomonas sp. Root68]KRB63573.1 hypothetical protein ASD95_17775 [Pseudomonas sp. Root71]